MLERFERSNALGPDIVVYEVGYPPIWPSVGDWMIVTCYDDDSARYGIAPFADAAKVSNPREVCAAVRREVED